MPLSNPVSIAFKIIHVIVWKKKSKHNHYSINDQYPYAYIFNLPHINGFKQKIHHYMPSGGVLFKIRFPTGILIACHYYVSQSAITLGFKFGKLIFCHVTYPIPNGPSNWFIIGSVDASWYTYVTVDIMYSLKFNFVKTVR